MLRLRPQSLDWALKHAISQGDTDVFPNAFEFQAIKHDWHNIRRILCNQDVLSWQCRTLRQCLSPKQRFGFRIATQLDPLDFLLFGGLVYEIGQDIEARRLPVSNQNVFSHRFNPAEDGSLFDMKVGYRAFQDHSRGLAASSTFSHVVLADIADFFPRLYHHRVEGALSSATTKNNHVKAICRMLSGWNQSLSYGIPVGSAPSRLVAEIAIDDVDKSLRSEGIDFVRYVDDFRLFATSFNDGYKQLTTLANVLFKNHGLTLQQAKTSIITTEEFEHRFARTEESQELDGLAKKFNEFLESVGILDPYGNIEYEALDAEDQNKIDSLNLEELLLGQLRRPEPDIDQRMVKFLLRRLGQLDNAGCVDQILEHMDKLFTVFPEVIRYLSRLRSLDNLKRHQVGQQMLSLIDNSALAHLEFHRVWLFSLFSGSTEWGNAEKLGSLFSNSHDLFSQRELTLGLAKVRQDYWFRSRKNAISEFSPWLKRAFLAGASCLPQDERKHWYDFLEPQLDDLEKAVMRWARANPF